MNVVLRLNYGALFGALLLFCVTFANAHSDVFADIKINAVFDKNGFVGVENIWSFDEMYTREMLAVTDEDGDGRFSLKEMKNLEKLVLSPYENADYFNFVLSGAKFLKAKEMKMSSAGIQNGRLILKFVLLYPEISASKEYSMLVITVFDFMSNIVMTIDMDGSSVKNEALDVDFFADKLEGLTLFREFSAKAEGLYVRFRRK